MFSAKETALIASMSSVYAGYSFLSSNTIGGLTHGVDTFFLRSLLFVVLSFTGVRAGSASLMGLVSGTIIEFTTPSPIHFYIFPSVVSYGVTYDIFTWKRRSMRLPGSATVLLATLLSSTIMAVIALAVFTLAGFFPPEILPIMWFFGIMRDALVGVAGAFAGIKIANALLDI
ncbi:MAG: hypothetical protein JSW72_07845 [Candidatus Bathyarchaeota archaeon]|nr:MAG: hypothetical protein JSW72_07845 [Candidatus Bathyarchaeota archaeon]